MLENTLLWYRGGCEIKIGDAEKGGAPRYEGGHKVIIHISVTINCRITYAQWYLIYLENIFCFDTQLGRCGHIMRHEPNMRHFGLSSVCPA